MADIWKLARIEALAPTPKAWADGKELADGGALRDIRPHAELPRTWQATTHGSSGTYTTLVIDHTTGLGFNCTCPSSQYPCKHALGLAYHFATHPELRPEPEPPPAVAPELDALLRACFASPKANLPRLVLADYLEERGETDRATILRIQCALPPTRKGEKPKIPRGATEPLAEAIRRLKPTLEPLKDAGIEFAFVRGFLAIRTTRWNPVRGADASPQFRDLAHTGWIEAIDLASMYTPITAELVALLREVGTLDFTHWLLDDDALITIASELRPGLPESRVRTLIVHKGNRDVLAKLLGSPTKAPTASPPTQSYTALTPASAKLLAESGTLDGIEHLGLGGDPGEDGFRALVESPAMRTLSSLGVAGIDLSADGWRRHWAVRNRHLKWLHVSATPLGDAGVRDFCAGAFVPTEHLTLSGVGLTAGGVRALASCDRLATLEHLDLSGNVVGDDGMNALLTSATFAGLATLRLPRCGVTPAAMVPAVFAARPRPELSIASDNLRVTLTRPAGRAAEFRLCPTDFGRTAQKCPLAGTCPEPLSAFKLEEMPASRLGLRQVRDWLAGQTVPTLSFPRCGLRNDDVPALLDLIEAVRPTTVELISNEIGVKGCQALAASPVLASVEELSLSYNPIRLNGALALAGSLNRGKLKHFHAVGLGFTAAEEKKVTAAFKGVRVTL